MEVITRKQAQEQGLTHYFTGKPCKHGHIAKRLVTSKSCVVCNCANTKKHYHGNLKGDAAFQAQNRQRASAWYYENHERARETRNAYANAQGDKEVARQNERSSLRQRKMRKALQGMTKQEKIATRAIYQLRITLTRETGVEYHVDHCIPLSEGGQHHPDNLWVIPAVDNLRKGAKMPAEAAA